MNPFARIPNDPSIAMDKRQRLLAMPLEFFRQFCGGRIPTLEEKVFLVERAVLDSTPQHIFQNDLYTVLIGTVPPFVRLTVWRHDRQPCKEWAHLQQIKNELIGREHEAAELFPAESRLVDAGNEYHLWVHMDPHYRFPFGFESRCVPEGGFSWSDSEASATAHAAVA